MAARATEIAVPPGFFNTTFGSAVRVSVLETLTAPVQISVPAVVFFKVTVPPLETSAMPWLTGTELSRMLTTGAVSPFDVAAMRELPLGAFERVKLVVVGLLTPWKLMVLPLTVTASPKFSPLGLASTITVSPEWAAALTPYWMWPVGVTTTVFATSRTNPSVGVTSMSVT